MKAQQYVHGKVKERGYLEGWTDAQAALLQIAKMEEEAAELAFTLAVIDGPTPSYLSSIHATGYACRQAFDSPRQFRCDKVHNLEEAKAELADVQVVVFVLAEILKQMTGDDFDVVAAAEAKVRKDVGRGTR